MSPPDGNDVAPTRKATPETNPCNPIPARPLSQLPSGYQGVIGSSWAMAGQQSKRLTLMGPPVSRRKQRKLGIERFVVGIGYQKRSCSRCGDHTWLGPKQLARLEAEPETEVACSLCILPELKAGLKDGSVALTHLGGRGAGYYQNKRYFGPPEEFRN